MENEVNDRTIAGAEAIRNRLIEHINDLRDFARLPAELREEIIFDVRDYIRDNFASDAYKFAIGIEYFLRLNEIDKFPELYANTIERDSPDAQKPQSHIEKYFAQRFAENETSRTGDAPQFIVAESAVFINFGNGTRLNDRSLLIVADREQNGTFIEFPFGFGGQIALRGNDAILSGRDKSINSFKQFEEVIRKLLYFDKPQMLIDAFDYKDFRFFAFGSSRDLTDAVDSITLSDDVIEIKE